MITWKGAVLIILCGWVTATTADNQPTQFRRFLATILGIYGLGLPAMFFVFIDMGIYPR